MTEKQDRPQVLSYIISAYQLKQKSAPDADFYFGKLFHFYKIIIASFSTYYIFVLENFYVLSNLLV